MWAWTAPRCRPMTSNCTSHGTSAAHGRKKAAGEEESNALMRKAEILDAQEARYGKGKLGT